MIVSTQAPFRDRFEIGHALGLDPASIRIISPYLGGGFGGGKDGATVQCLLAPPCPLRPWAARQNVLGAGRKLSGRL